MKKLELDIKANDKDWLYEQYVIKQRGMKSIAIECDTTEDSIRTRLKRFDIDIRSHKKALKIRNSKYPIKFTIESRKKSNDIKRTGRYINCKFCNESFYINKKSQRKFCSRECLNSHKLEHRKHGQDWRDWAEYKEWRNLVYYRDLWKCKICDSKKEINAHHILEAQKFPEKRFDVSNGITLCKKHHIQVHSPSSEELLEKNPNIGGSPEVDNPEASIREYLFSLIRSND